MRITLINQFYAPDVSPTAHLAASLADDLAQRGHDVTVVASQGSYAATPTIHHRDAATNPRIIRVWTPSFGRSNIIRRLGDYVCFYLGAIHRLLSLPRQDILISLTTPPFIVTAALLHKLVRRKSRVVLWNMDCYPEVLEAARTIRSSGLISRVLQCLNRKIFRAVDHIVCLDTAMQEMLQLRYSSDSNLISTSIIPNWEQFSRFPRDHSVPAWEKTGELLIRGHFVVLYLGNAGFGHCFETVVEAAKQLRHDSITFLFVGGGKRWADLRTAKKRHQLDNIVLHDYVPKSQTRSVMQAADCALITLDHAALGVMSPSKLHASLAAGLPVLYIGPAKSNVDTAIRLYDCGVSLRHDDVRRTVDFLRSAAREPGRLQQLKINSRKAFEQAYCDRKTLPQFYACLQMICGADASATPPVRPARATPSRKAA